MKSNKLPARLRAARMAQGLSLRDVERLSDDRISNPYLNQIELGREGDVNPRKLRVLAKILKLDFLEVMILAGYLTVQDLKGKI